MTGQKETFRFSVLPQNTGAFAASQFRSEIDLVGLIADFRNALINPIL